VSAITLRIDEVRIKDTDYGFELCDDTDPQASGFISYFVEVEYDRDGEWNISQVYRDTEARTQLRGPHSLKVAKFLDGYQPAIDLIEGKLSEMDDFRVGRSYLDYHEAGRTL
jgi:hypothetical protein